MAKPTKRTHNERIQVLEKTIINLHDSVLPSMQQAIAERDSVVHACVLQLHKLDPDRKLVKVAGEQGMFYIFASDEELAELQKPVPAEVSE